MGMEYVEELDEDDRAVFAAIGVLLAALISGNYPEDDRNRGRKT